MDTNDNDNRFYMAPWPTLCDECGDAITRFAASRPDLDCFMTHCPHRFTFALLYVGTVDGNRGVIRWDVQGPLTQSAALSIMEKMAPFAAKIVNLDDPSLQ